MGLTVEQMKANVEEFKRKQKEKQLAALRHSRADMTNIIRRLRKAGLDDAAALVSTAKVELAMSECRIYRGQL